MFKNLLILCVALLMGQAALAQVASATRFGVVKIGSGLTMTNGVLSATGGGGGSGYTPGTPTVTIGTAGGVSATVSLEAGSNDLRGYVNVTYAGSGSNGSGDIFTLTFGNAFSATPGIIVQAANSAMQGFNTRYFQQNESPTGFTITARSTVMTSNQVYRFAYIVQP